MTHALTLFVVLGSATIGGLAVHEFLHTIPLRFGGYPFSYQFRPGGPRFLPAPFRLLFGSPGVRIEVSVLRVPHRRLQMVAIAPAVLLPVGYAIVMLTDSSMMTLIGAIIGACGLPSAADCRYLFGIGRQKHAIKYSGAHYHHRLAEGVPDPFIHTSPVS